LDDREKKEIEEIRKRAENIFCRRCDYCLPCPEEIPIQNFLAIRTVPKRLGKSFLMEGMHREFIEKAKLCSECGECITRCPYQLPIPELIKENLRWVDEQLK